jgi:hypothetical protein
MGFWEHPDMLEAIKESIDRVNHAIPLGGAADVEVSVKMARMGVSVHPVLDEFYDEYVGIAFVSSMWTERMLSKLKRQIGGLICINAWRVSFRMYKYNSLGKPPCDGVEWKGIMKELRQETGDHRSAKDAGAVPDHHRFIAAFEKQYAQVERVVCSLHFKVNGMIMSYLLSQSCYPVFLVDA